MQLIKFHKKNKLRTNIYLFIVPLYLVILVFFIIINSFSVSHDNSNLTTLISIQNTFKNNTNVKNHLEKIKGDSSFNKSEFFNKLLYIFQQMTYQNDIKLSNNDDILYLSIPENRIFKNDTIEIQDSFSLIFADLMRTYIDYHNNVQMTFNIVLHSNQLSDKLLIDRLSAFNKITHIDYGASDINIGFAKSNNNHVLFEMRF